MSFFLLDDSIICYVSISNIIDLIWNRVYLLIDSSGSSSYIDGLS
jgi:hypothetical protein